MSAVTAKPTVSTPRTMCCKVCKDSNEPESVWSNHYVKDRNGNVTCPKLKTIVCLNCNKRGHTSGYCKAPLRKVATTEKPVSQQPKTPLVTTGASRFSCLCDSDSEDDGELVKHKKYNVKSGKNKMPTITVKEPKYEATESNENIKVSDESFPVLSTKTVAKFTETKTVSYAGIAAKPVETKTVRQHIIVPDIPVKRPASPLTLPPSYIFTMKASEMDWAAYDSESDDSDVEDDE